MPLRVLPCKSGFKGTGDTWQDLEQGSRRGVVSACSGEPVPVGSFCLRNRGMVSAPHIPGGWTAPAQGDVSLQFSLKGRDTLGNMFQTGC